MIKAIFCLLLISITSLSCVKSKAKEIEVVTVNEMQTNLHYNSVEKPEIKSKEDFKKSHLINAEEVLNNADLKESLKELDKNAPIAVYFTSKNKLYEAAAILQDLGFLQIYVLDGGIKKWDAINQVSK